MKLTAAVLVVVLFVALAWNAQADDYLDVGFGIHDGEFDTFSHYNKKTRTVHKLSPVIYFFEWGYETKDGAIFLRHESDSEKVDTGLTMIGIKVRLF